MSLRSRAYRTTGLVSRLELTWCKFRGYKIMQRIRNLVGWVETVVVGLLVFASAVPAQQGSRPLSKVAASRSVPEGGARGATAQKTRSAKAILDATESGSASAAGGSQRITNTTPCEVKLKSP